MMRVGMLCIPYFDSFSNLDTTREKRRLTDKVQRADAQSSGFQETEKGREKDWVVVWGRGRRG
jgi:hypothetical protein